MDQYAAEAQDTFFVAREEKLPGFFAFMRLKGSRMGMLAQDRTCQAMGSRYTGEYPDDAVWMAAKTTEGSIYGKEVYKMLFGKHCHHHGAGRPNLRGQVAGSPRHTHCFWQQWDRHMQCVHCSRLCGRVCCSLSGRVSLYHTRHFYSTTFHLDRDGDLTYIWNP